MADPRSNQERASVVRPAVPLRQVGHQPRAEPQRRLGVARPQRVDELCIDEVVVVTVVVAVVVAAVVN